MEKIKKFLLAILVFAFITSCDKDESNPKETNNTTNSNTSVENQTISAKWVVNNSSEYESFEFNESGNYIIVENQASETTKITNNEQLIHFGTYEIIDDNTIELSDFGTLTIDDIDANTINLSINKTSDPDNEIIISASRQDEMESSTNTDLLCRTWKMITENGEPVAGTDIELTILFSRAGTYFVTYVNSEVDNQGGLAQWKWDNNAETELLYSWDNWGEAGLVEVTELTSTTLTIVEDGDVWELIPATTTEQVKLITSSEASDKSLKKGIFRK